VVWRGVWLRPEGELQCVFRSCVRALRYILSRGYIDIVLQYVAVCCCRENSVLVCALRYILSRTYPLELIDRHDVASMLRYVVAG